jgi:exonuclease SbcD
MSLKILHTSDWHLGRCFRETRFDLFPVQRLILNEIVNIVEHRGPQIVIIAGDIFDTYNPPFDAEYQFYETIIRIVEKGCLVVAIAGNHDSPDKLSIGQPLIQGKHPILIVNSLSEGFVRDYEDDRFIISVEEGFFKIRIKDESVTVALKAVPYPSEARLSLSGEEFAEALKKNFQTEPQFTCDYFVIASHLFLSGAIKSGSERIFQIGGADSIPLEYFSQRADYIALGHLHKYQCIGNATYSGSIYTFDMGEIGQNKGVCLWEENNSERKIQLIDFTGIPQIRKLEFPTLEEAINNVPDDQSYYYVVIRSSVNYRPDLIERMIKAYGDRLVNWRFESIESSEEQGFVDITEMDEDERFRGYYRSKNHSEPDEDLVKLFLECLREARNVTN